MKKLLAILLSVIMVLSLVACGNKTQDETPSNDDQQQNTETETKTIKVGESYTPVVMGIATGKKVDATVTYGKDIQGTKVNAQYIDVEDGATVIGTQEGVAYITASYKTNNGVEYVASSMKIVVAGATEVAPAEGTTTYYVTCRTLNVRKGAGTSYAKAGKLHRGDKVEVVSISKNWAKLANGTYVSAKYIAK